MGYDQGQRRKTYGLNMLPYPGLTIDVRKPGFSALQALTRAVLVLGSDFDGGHVTADVRMIAWDDLFAAFADSLVAWNLTDRGRAVPATRDGVLSQDPEFLLDLSRTWYTMVVLAPVREQDPAPEDHPPAEVEIDDRTAPDDDDEWLATIPTTTQPAPPEPVGAGA